MIPVGFPNSTYKILITGRAGGYRHESIVDFEWMIQQLGQQYGFDVDIWDPTISTSPGRFPPAGVSLATSPFLDPAKLAQYKTIVFNSTVGRDGTSTMNATEFANFQQYIHNGGGFVGIHGGTDSMQDVPWYENLMGAAFTDHGSDEPGGILADTGAGGSFIVDSADPAHASLAQVPQHFFTVDEAYNINRNPVDMGLVHPLQYLKRGLCHRSDRLQPRHDHEHRPAPDDVVPQLRGRHVRSPRSSGTAGCTRMTTGSAR